jgi:hypothetical protein
MEEGVGAAVGAGASVGAAVRVGASARLSNWLLTTRSRSFALARVVGKAKEGWVTLERTVPEAKSPVMSIVTSRFSRFRMR